MILWLAGCSPEVAQTASAPVELRTWIAEEPKSGSGVLVVQLENDDTLPVEAPKPEVPGLTFTPKGSARVEDLGTRTVTTQEWEFSGAAGHYEIYPLHVEAGGQGVQSESLFVDIDTAPPEAGKLADIAESAPIWTIPWTPVLVVGGVLAVFAGGIVLAFVGLARRPLPPVVEEPPDVLCLRAWDAIRSDGALSPEEKAKALSRLFRDYVEAVLHFPAARWTTTETLDQLTAMKHLETGNVPRAKRLLRATDLIKYAEQRPGADLFDDLDADLRAFVTSTKPHHYGTLR